MSSQIYRYKIEEEIPVEETEESLLLACVATEIIHGRSRTIMDGAFHLDKSKRECVIDARTEVGRSIACLFTGLMTMEFGEDSFQVEFVDEPPKCRCSGGP